MPRKTKETKVTRFLADVPEERRKDDGGPQDSTTPDRWFTASNGAVAGLVTSQAKQIEQSNWSTTSYLEFVCARYLTGRNPGGSFGYSMSTHSGRAATDMATAQYGAPSLNVIGCCADVFQNKIFKNRPWLVYMPTVKGSWKDRRQCKALGQFVDAAFEAMHVYDDAQLCGMDCMQFRSAFYGVGPGLDGKSLKGERILAQEILLTAGDSGSYNKPTSAIRRVFCNRQALIQAYAKGDKADEIASAIRHAPGVFAGYIPSKVDYDEICALCAGYKLPGPNGEPGRYVLAVGDVALEDKPWTRKGFPWAKLDFNVLSNEYMGQSMAEIQLKLQRQLDRLEAAIDESEQRVAWPRFAIESSSNVNTEQFAGPGFIDYTGTAPIALAGEVPSELYESRDTKIGQIFQRVGISQSAAGGNKPEGLSSGLSILAWNQVDDSRHVDLAQRYEDFIVQIGDLIIETAAEVNPSFMVDGRQAVKWAEVEMDTDRFKVSAFPLSRLPQTISGKLQQINDWYVNGTITRQQKLRLEGMPDLQGFVDLATSSEEWVAKTLDTIIDSHYVPPLPYIDATQALTDAQARFLYESTMDTDPKRLMRLTKFISALKEQMALQPPPTPATQPAAPANVTAPPIPQ